MNHFIIILYFHLILLPAYFPKQLSFHFYANLNSFHVERSMIVVIRISQLLKRAKIKIKRTSLKLLSRATFYRFLRTWMCPFLKIFFFFFYFSPTVKWHNATEEKRADKSKETIHRDYIGQPPDNCGCGFNRIAGSSVSIFAKILGLSLYNRPLARNLGREQTRIGVALNNIPLCHFHFSSTIIYD